MVDGVLDEELRDHHGAEVQDGGVQLAACRDGVRGPGGPDQHLRQVGTTQVM